MFISSKTGIFVFVMLIGISLQWNPCFGVLIPDVGESQNCSIKLAKLNSNPLRPKGSEVQEKYFKLIDEVAEEFNGTNKFNSPVAWRRKTAKSGLPGLDLPKEVGGENLKPSEMVKIFQYAGRHSLDLRDISGGGHARSLLMSKEPGHKEILEKVVQGKGYMAIAITEPEYGSDIGGMKSSSKKVEGGYEITGEKKYNARLKNASHVVIITQAPNSTPEHSKLNAFCLPIDYPGLKFKDLKAPGLKGNSFGGVSFDKLVIPEKFRIGEDGEGHKLFGEHFTYWRVMQTAAAIGTAQKALEQTAERLATRIVNGKPIGAMTHLQQPLGKLTFELNMVFDQLEKAAKLMDGGDYKSAAVIAAAAKSWGVDKAFDAVDSAISAHAASGYSDNMDLMQRLNDLRGLRIADGASDVLISDYVRKIYGQEFWDMAFGSR